MSEPTRDELMQRLADALAGQESAVMALIWFELGELYTGLEASEDQAAAALRDACSALEVPEAHLAALDREINAAEGRCVEWSEQLADADPDIRAKSRMHFQEWSAEVDARRARRDEAERDYRELFAARDEAQTRLRIVQAAKQRVMLAQLNPFGDELAQATEAYRSLRLPMLGMVLLRRDRESAEWDQAIGQLRTWCAHSGYRTDDLPSEAEQMARAMTAAMADAAASIADPVPSPVELKAQTEVDFGNMALEQSAARNVIDDRRGARYQAEPPARSYMQLPGRGAR